MADKVSSIGGQALMEGVMMRGPKSMAMSVRDGDGMIQTESEWLKPQKWYNKAPIIRGVVAFVSSLVMRKKSFLTVPLRLPPRLAWFLR